MTLRQLFTYGGARARVDYGHGVTPSSPVNEWMPVSNANPAGQKLDKYGYIAHCNQTASYWNQIRGHAPLQECC